MEASEEAQRQRRRCQACGLSADQVGEINAVQRAGLGIDHLQLHEVGADPDAEPIPFGITDVWVCGSCGAKLRAMTKEKELMMRAGGMSNLAPITAVVKRDHSVLSPEHHLPRIMVMRLYAMQVLLRDYWRAIGGKWGKRWADNGDGTWGPTAVSE